MCVKFLCKFLFLLIYWCSKWWIANLSWLPIPKWICSLTQKLMLVYYDHFVLWNQNFMWKYSGREILLRIINSVLLRQLYVQSFFSILSSLLHPKVFITLWISCVCDTVGQWVLPQGLSSHPDEIFTAFETTSFTF